MFDRLRRALALLDPASRARLTLSSQADHLEQRYGRDAIVWVLRKIERSPKASRARLYRLHDELARRHYTYVRHH